MKLFKIALMLLLCYNLQARMAEGVKTSANTDVAIASQGADDIDIHEEFEVHKQGKFWMTITNYGKYGDVDNAPYDGHTAPAGIHPGVWDEISYQYIYSGSLWIGGYLETKNDETGLSEFSGPFVTTGGDGWQTTKANLKPTMFTVDDAEVYESRKHITESSTLQKTNWKGENVYDPMASAEEQFTAWYTDQVTDPTVAVKDPDTNQPHMPLGVEIKQVSYAWSYEYAEDFVLFDFTVYNFNRDKKDIVNMFIGMYQDSDCGRTDNAASNEISADDISGFKKDYQFIDPATGDPVTKDINCAWTADNDGREYKDQNGQPEESSSGPLDGARGVVAVRVVRTPNPKLQLSFNWWNSNGDEKYDYGPRWKSGSSLTSNNGEHSDWPWDLTYDQNGYLDYSKADISADNTGPTEGTPQAPIGRYQVMSNGEFDYDQYLVDEAPSVQEDYEHPITGAVSSKQWEDLTTTSLSEDDITDISNGYDTRFFLSFGPLGQETTATFKNKNYPDGETKTIYRFAYGDSVKLTLALLVGEDFHVSDKQDYKNLKPGLFGYADLANNALWAEKVYDNPLYDTPVTVDGVTKRDGWYGEDVGEDGLFAEKTGQTCWWAGDAVYKESDNGENDGLLTTLSAAGAVATGATSEDDIAMRGNTTIDEADDGNEDTIEIGLSETYGWQNPDGVGPDGYERYGYNDGMLQAGDGLPDFKGPPSPPSPDLKIQYDGNDVVVKWASDNFAHELSGADADAKRNGSSENYIDPFSKLQDFEGYQIWMAKNASGDGAAKLLEVDNVDYAYEDINRPGKYLPADIGNGFDIFPMTQEKRDELVNERNRECWDTLGTVYKIVKIDSNNDIEAASIKSTDPEAVNWEYQCDKTSVEGVRIYSMRLRNRIKGKTFFVAVTASDFGDPQSSTAPLTSSLSNNITAVTPSTDSESDDPVVVPNPYRADVDYEAMNWENGGANGWGEQDRKIAFINIPKECIVRIYTAAGDIVRTLSHNGTEDNNMGDYGTYWDMLNGNSQTVASGLYFYTVQDAADKDDVFVGKFAIIR